MTWIFCRPNWISIFGERYYSQEFVLVGFQDDDLPVFGRIQHVIVVCGTPLLALKIYKTVCLYSHLSAYQIIETNSVLVVLLSELETYQPYCSHLYIGDNQTYITMRSKVINN